MIAKTVIPYTSAAGSQYLIQLKPFESDDNFGINIIDVSIALILEKEKVVSLGDLVTISRMIKDYLIDNKVVLYYYCDHSSDDIFISERNIEKTPQEYRSNLFESLFDFMETDGFIKDQIIIGDQNSPDAHFISIISKEEDKSFLTDISIAVQKMNDK